MFNVCHESTLWTHTIGYSAQTDSTVRCITMAIGSQQRLVESGVGDPVLWTWASANEADILYQRSIFALQIGRAHV